MRAIVLLVPIVLVIELPGALLRLTLSLLTVDVVGALCLGESIDLCTREAGEDLLGEGVVDFFAYASRSVSKVDQWGWLSDDV